MSTALITGAGAIDGIGIACARALAAAGFRIAITSTTERIHARTGELRAAGIDATGHVANLTDALAVDRLKEAIGPVEILINNAGMGTIDSPAVQARLVDMTQAQWNRGIDVSLNTAFLVTRALLPAMIQNRYGRIVNIASVTGPYVSNPGEAAYSAAKAGMIGLTKTLAREFAGRSVTVNAVAPGFIKTDMTTEFVNNPEAAAKILEVVPLKRFGEAADVAHLTAYLCSEQAGYVTGQVFAVDGGMAM